MAKRLYCPQCNEEYWGKGKKAKCVCGYVFTEEDKRKALGLTMSEIINETVPYNDILEANEKSK